MPDHDHELIAALAEGRLDPERAAEAERAIAENPAAAELLAAHRLALDATANAPRAALTDEERSDLRMRVSEAIGLDRSPEPATRRRTPWAAVSIAAATLAALVAVVPLTGLLSDSDDSSGATVGMLELDDAARSTSEAGDVAGTPDPADFGAETVAESDAGGEPVSTTAAVSAPAAQESLTLEERLTTLIAEPEDPNDGRLSPTRETACGAEATEHIGTPLEELRFAELTLDDRQAMVFFTVVDGEPEMVAAFSADGCELIESLP